MLQRFGTYAVDLFGSLPNGGQIYRITLTAPSGISLEVLSLGATIHRLYIPSEEGLTDVVLGKPDLAAYLENGLCNSSVIGRCANRVAGASYVWKGRRVALQANLGRHCIHGGSGCYAMKEFAFSIRCEPDALRLCLWLMDRGEGGFPGQVAFRVDYVLGDDSVTIEYQAVPTEDTIWNVTSHAYFDLNGHGSGAADKQILRLFADSYLPAFSDGVPTGERRSVEGTCFDFREPRRLSEALQSADEQLSQFGGFDHNFCIDGHGFRQSAELRGLQTGIRMEVWTDCPGMQLFTLNQVPPEFSGKDGRYYSRHGAVCLESQHYPDAIHHPEWPNPVIPAGMCSRTKTAFIFR